MLTRDDVIDVERPSVIGIRKVAVLAPSARAAADFATNAAVHDAFRRTRRGAGADSAFKATRAFEWRIASTSPTVR